MRETLLIFKHRFRDPKSCSVIMHRNAIAAKGTSLRQHLVFFKLLGVLSNPDCTESPTRHGKLHAIDIPHAAHPPRGSFNDGVSLPSNK